jgi:hypothetical protein
LVALGWSEVGSGGYRIVGGFAAGMVVGAMPRGDCVVTLAGYGGGAVSLVGGAESLDRGGVPLLNGRPLASALPFCGRGRGCGWAAAVPVSVCR